MDITDKLTEIFKEFPGVGARQARRFVYFLMSKNGAFAENLAGLISELKREISRCPECFRFFIQKKVQGAAQCDICANPNADGSVLMILEKDSDLESVARSRVYDGKYFLLGGLVPIVEKSTPSFVRISELKARLEKDKDIKEIILAFSLSPQGEHTDHYVRGELENIAQAQGIKLSSLGRGLSTGTELEYSDNDTIKNALKNRQ